MLNIWGEFLGSSVVRALAVAAKGPGRSLVGELKSHKLHVVVKKKKKNEFLKPVLINV